MRSCTAGTSTGCRRQRPVEELPAPVTIELKISTKCKSDRHIGAVSEAQTTRATCWRSRSPNNSTDEFQGIARALASSFIARAAAASSPAPHQPPGLQGGRPQHPPRQGRARRHVEAQAGQPDFTPADSATSSPTPEIGMVQARWGQPEPRTTGPHPGPGHPPRRPAGHRAPRRYRSSLCFNYKRTPGGIWRRTAIAEQRRRRRGRPHRGPRPLLPGRQMKGWRFVYLAGPRRHQAEVPVEMSSFGSQQHRWAKGSQSRTRPQELLLAARPQGKPPKEVQAARRGGLTANIRATCS